MEFFKKNKKSTIISIALGLCIIGIGIFCFQKNSEKSIDVGKIEQELASIENEENSNQNEAVDNVDSKKNDGNNEKIESSNNGEINSNNSEIMYIISGTGHYEYDGVREEVQAGSVHYCPMNHSHWRREKKRPSPTLTRQLRLISTLARS